MSEINMTPLIDVMLVLLVIFIITAPLLSSSLRLDLPKTDAAKADGTAAFITLMLDKSGQAFINDRPVDATELARQLGAAAEKNPDTEVQLRADTAVPYGHVVEVISAAQKAGLARIGFVAEAPKSGG